MTLDELIENLQRVREFHGGTAPVIVTGAYGSWADDLDIVYSPIDKTCVFIHTSICSG